jgi:predicted permease
VTLYARLRSWIRASTRRGTLEQAMHDEMQLHMELYEADLRNSGLSPDEARRRTRIEFGSVEARKDECREELGLRLVDELRADVVYALRLLRRSPGFTLVALLSLGLGIGANTAIFSLVDTVLVRSLPVADPDRLFFLDNSGGKSGGSSGPPYPCYEIWRDHNRFLSGVAAFDDSRAKVTIDGTPELLGVHFASGSLFEVLGVGAVHGRVLTPADDQPSGGPEADGAAAVISHALWTRQFGRDPAVLGKVIQVGTRSVTIVGVTPPDYLGLQVGSPIDVTVPIALAGNSLQSRELWWFSVIGRLKPDATVEQARSDLERLWDTYMREIGQPPERRTYFSGISLVPAAGGLNGLRGRFAVPLLIAMAIVAVVLLIGCANLANLLLARASARRDEIAVRLAIGASRGRVTRQLLTEGAVLVLLGTAVGLAFGRWGLSLLVDILADNARIVLDVAFDRRVFAFTAVVAAVTGVLFSIAPAMQAHHVATRRPAAGKVTAGRPHVRLGQALVVTQVTLSVLLLCIAGLFLRTLHNLHGVDAGFDSGNVLTLQVEATVPERSRGPRDPARSRAEHARLGGIWEDFVAGVIAMPDVTAAAVATMSPLTGRDRGVLIAILGARFPDEDRYIHINQVTAGYFDTMGLEVRAGRAFNARDRASAPRVAILNESAARAYFASGSAIGRIVRFPGQRVEDPYEVVGVVRDARYETLRKPDERMAYLPIEQSIDPITEVMLAVRGEGDVTRFVAPIRDMARRSVPSGFVSRVSTLDQQVQASLTGEHLVSILATFFGGLALVLACIGLYGVMAQGVISRGREIAVRIAIGARSATVVWMVVRGTVTLLLVGILAGMGAALAAGRYVRSQLFEVSPADPLAIAAAVTLLAAVTIAASYVPARRATRIDPAAALRAE